MKQFHQTVLLFVALTTMSMTIATDAQSTYADCSANYTVLESALLETSDNLFQLTTTYFNPTAPNPLYVDIYYNFLSVNNQAHYIWSAAPLYLIVAPPAVGYLSLFFGYIIKTRMTTLTLQLPENCAELINTTSTSTSNLLLVLTHRVNYHQSAWHYACFFSNICLINAPFMVQIYKYIPKHCIMVLISENKKYGHMLRFSLWCVYWVKLHKDYVSDNLGGIIVIVWSY